MPVAQHGSIQLHYELWPRAGSAADHGSRDVGEQTAHVYTTDEPKADLHVARFLKAWKETPALVERLLPALPGAH